MVQINPNHVPRVKLVLHVAQIVFAFVVWCLEIAVFTGKDARIVGNNAWTFAVCFLSVPGWAYLIMAPRFERARNIAEPHAMLVFDFFFTILWLSAFATQASYNTAGMCGEVCRLSKAIVGLAVIITLLFAGSTAVSAYTLQFYNFHGDLPGYEARASRRGESTNIDPDKAAFSMAPHGEEAYERVNMDDHEAGAGSHHDSGRYTPANPYSADDFDDPNRYGTAPRRSDDILHMQPEYSPGRASASPTYGRPSQNPYMDEPAQFPSGHYDRAQS